MVAASLLCLFLSFQEGEPVNPFASLDANRYTVRPLTGLISPTALIFVKDTLFVGCDLLEPMPGIYRIAPEGQANPGLVFHMPQVAIEGLSHGTDAKVHVAASRVFSAYPKEWRGQIQTVNLKDLQQTALHKPGLDPLCSDESHQCGLVAAYPLGERQWLMVTRQNVAEIILMRFDGTDWSRIISLPVFVDGRQTTLSGFALMDKQLVFLSQNRWALSTAPLKDLFAPNAWRLQTKKVLDISNLKREFPVENTVLQLQGFAEDFAFDAQGNLHVLLNNRGYPFTPKGFEREKRDPLLITYTRK